MPIKIRVFFPTLIENKNWPPRPMPRARIIATVMHSTTSRWRRWDSSLDFQLLTKSSSVETQKKKTILTKQFFCFLSDEVKLRPKSNLSTELLEPSDWLTDRHVTSPWMKGCTLMMGMLGLGAAPCWSPSGLAGMCCDWLSTERLSSGLTLGLVGVSTVGRSSSVTDTSSNSGGSCCSGGLAFSSWVSGAEDRYLFTSYILSASLLQFVISNK